MGLSASKQVQNEWKNKIIEQRQSNLSITSWCRQNHVAVHSFYYWRDKFFPKAPLDRSAFKEISETTSFSCGGIKLEFQGFFIHLDQQFDSTILKNCLKVLKEC